jgi:hypothetical protein
MEQPVTINPRIHQRHPELNDADVLAAWVGCIRAARRTRSAFDDFVAVGFDKKGRLLEMVAVLREDESWHIYHAFSPPTSKVLAELGLL